ncbi:MAG: hypothetical protein JWO50_784 [Candidatus Kaiserbacteria bacterium]|nr:hypothetical protein [Candidatus Kaiserbacteria bacterium]
MDTGLSSSLIPHERITAPGNQSHRGGLEDVVLLLAIIILVASAALGGATFLYQQFTTTQISSKQQSLENERKALDPSTIDHLVKVSQQLQTADSLLTAHTAPNALFAALSQATLQTVTFDGISYNADDPKKITISMGGTAQSVNSVALQAEVFAKNNIIVNPIFSGVNRQQNGVRFNVTAQINPAAVSYEQLVAGSAAVQQQTTPQTNPVQTTSPFGTPQSGATQ